MGSSPNFDINACSTWPEKVRGESGAVGGGMVLIWSGSAGMDALIMPRGEQADTPRRQKESGIVVAKGQRPTARDGVTNVAA